MEESKPYKIKILELILHWIDLLHVKKKINMSSNTCDAIHPEKFSPVKVSAIYCDQKKWILGIRNK